jgi:hypothetical protein
MQKFYSPRGSAKMLLWTGVLAVVGIGIQCMVAAGLPFWIGVALILLTCAWYFWRGEVES